jgi:hypothetical protein
MKTFFYEVFCMQAPRITAIYLLNFESKFKHLILQTETKFLLSRTFPVLGNRTIHKPKQHSKHASITLTTKDTLKYIQLFRKIQNFGIGYTVNFYDD